MTLKILTDLIQNVNHNTIVRFFQDRTALFQRKEEKLTDYDRDQFTHGIKLGEIPFGLIDHMIVCAFNVTRPLSERSGKKAQYDLAKKVIQDMGVDAGIFVFIGVDGNFRFSLVYANYQGTRVDYSSFRRFTYFVSPQLTNKTFIQRIGEGDFSSLENIKEAFSVEKVTKEFYQKISYWYFWACQQCQFPKDAEAEENGRQVAVIRLITRMIFIWFMREMKLVPNHLFEKGFVSDALKTLDPQESSYYKAILQNLFFATLNTKPKERAFRSQVRGVKGINPDFGNQYKYRYQDLYHEPEQLKDYFGDIPFLNGGLFDCLDDKEHGRYVDGFTETKKHQPQVPNTLFFSSERNIDLNTELGTTNKTYHVEGLINILSTYNFTIDENTLDDQDVALDPELLGKVFENLLASFNPETSTTARKATGSYYTPREIVDYMVEEALKAYFQTHLAEIEGIEDKLTVLFQANSDENPFTTEETKRMVDLVDNVRIVDPAVGSGAFPMGALNKLVLILAKLDKDNALWKKAQLDAANAISDPAIRKNVKESIETYFREKDANYGRKLYLIQKCIYGVDIQQIAVEIAKLRFFIALLVDEKVDNRKDNWGIEPLPNLDFKIMQGNSLISDYLGIDFSIGGKLLQANGTLPLFEDENKHLIEDFDQKKTAYQTASDPEEKKALQGEIEDLLIKIFEDLVKKQKAEYFQRLEAIEKKYKAVPDKEAREHAIAEEKRLMAKNYNFDFYQVENELRQFTSRQRGKPFFPWELYFSEVFFEKRGFDLVIANPPYVRADNPDFKDQRELLLNCDEYKTLYEKWDLFVPFIEKGLKLLNENGGLVYITSNSILTSKFAFRILDYIQSNFYVMFIDYFSDDTPIFEASVVPVILGVTAAKISNYIKKKTHDERFGHIIEDELLLIDDFNGKGRDSFRRKKNVLNLNINTKMLGDLCYMSKGMVLNSDEKTEQGLFVKDDLISDRKTEKHTKEYIEGKDISNYCIKRIRYLEWDTKRVPKKLSRPTFSELYDGPKIMIGRVTGGIYDENGLVCNDSIVVMKKFGDLKQIKNLSISNSITKNNSLPRIELEKISECYDLRYLLAILNSKFANYYLNNIRRHRLQNYFYPNDYRKLPIVDLSLNEQESFIKLVNKIQRNSYSLENNEVLIDKETFNSLKEEIDQMVYQLYELSEEEIDAIEEYAIA